MTQEEKNALIAEQEEISKRMKESPFISPRDMRRVNEITSLLLSDGQTDEIRLKAGKPRSSKRVTSFTRDRR